MSDQAGIPQYDVAILGTGIAGTMLGAIFARQGKKVLMIEKEVHPRFALGESMILESSQMMRLTAERFGVPEIGYISTIQTTMREITSQCGVKKNFSFMYHRPGEQQKAPEITQIPIPSMPYGHELHMFRQDIDAYMMAAAVKYGADIRQRVDVTDVDFHADGAVLTTSRGEKFGAKFVADAGGYRSMLATKFDLRPKPLMAKTHSRSLFTHFVGVRPFHTKGHKLKEQGVPSALHEGTLHHIFHGGWFWIIPFNNHPNATNPLCSVGINLDTRMHPRPKGDPYEEFLYWVNRYPSITPQFEGAKPVRDWVSTDRIQYATTQVVGDRWCLMGHAAGAVDALYSRGMFHTTATVHAVADQVLEALEDNNFSRARFQHIEDTVQTGLRYNDRTVACSYASFCNFDLWNAWYRVYGLGAFLEALRLIRAHLKYAETGDAEFLRVLHHTPFRTLGGGLEGYDELWHTACETVESVEANRISPQEATKTIYGLFAKADFIPPELDLTNPNRRFLSDTTPAGVLKFIWWGKIGAPKYMKERFFDISVATLLSEKAKWSARNLMRTPPRAYAG